MAAFTRLAEDYCSFVESDAVVSMPRGALLRQLSMHLAALYAAALGLPDVDLGDWTEVDEPGAPPEPTPEPLLARLEAKFGDVDAYSFVFDPWDEADRQPVVGTLSDDVTAVYGELKDGLQALSAGSGTEEVVWDWRFTFKAHWGVHALHALYAIHWITQTAGARWLAPEDP